VKTFNEIRTEAMRYIRCNLPDRENIKFTGKGTVEVYFHGRPEFTFYLIESGNFKSGDVVRNNPSLGYRNSVSESFLGYDYEAARKWDIENAGCELSPGY
jgi:hypothetical protein